MYIIGIFCATLALYIIPVFIITVDHENRMELIYITYSFLAIFVAWCAGWFNLAVVK